MGWSARPASSRPAYSAHPTGRNAGGPSSPEEPESDVRRPPLVRRTFTVDGTPARARLYVSAHGLFEVELNGTRVGRDAMTPGWTVYGSRLRYLTYDIADMIAKGDNAIGAWLGDGWYRGRLGWKRGASATSTAATSAHRQVEVFDGGHGRQHVTVATDDRRRASPGHRQCGN